MSDTDIGSRRRLKELSTWLSGDYSALGMPVGRVRIRTRELINARRCTSCRSATLCIFDLQDTREEVPMRRAIPRAVRDLAHPIAAHSFLKEMARKKLTQCSQKPTNTASI